VQLTDTWEPVVTPVTSGSEPLSKLHEAAVAAEVPEVPEEPAEAVAGVVTIATTTAKAAKLASTAAKRLRVVPVRCDEPAITGGLLLPAWMPIPWSFHMCRIVPLTGNVHLVIWSPGTEFE
jgi:hypothetical protein